MERRAGVWWNTWGGLIVTLAAALASGLVSGFTIYHNMDKRLSVIELRLEYEVRMLRLELMERRQNQKAAL